MGVLCASNPQNKWNQVQHYIPSFFDRPEDRPEQLLGAALADLLPRPRLQGSPIPPGPLSTAGRAKVLQRVTAVDNSCKP